MRILKRILIGLFVIIVVLAGVGLLLPRKVHVERSTIIDAPRATVFAVVNSFKMFNRWSPWQALDPHAEYRYEGPVAGVGARMSWKGDPKSAGSGSQEITESQPPELVRTKLDFGDEGTAVAQLTLAPQGAGTRVTWGFDTDLGMNPVSRYFGLVFERMIGPDYEKGLANLRKLAEGLPKADFADLSAEEVDAAPVTVAYVTASCAKDDQEIAKAIGGAYAQVGKFMAAHKLKQAAAPITINNRYDDSGYEFDAAIPLDRAPDGKIPEDSPVRVKQTYAGKAIKAIHRGSYHNMGSTYEKLMAYAAAHGYETAGSPWDVYVSDPGNTPEADLVTHIFLPVR